MFSGQFALKPDTNKKNLTLLIMTLNDTKQLAEVLNTLTPNIQSLHHEQINTAVLNNVNMLANTMPLSPNDIRTGQILNLIASPGQASNQTGIKTQRHKKVEEVHDDVKKETHNKSVDPNAKFRNLVKKLTSNTPMNFTKNTGDSETHARKIRINANNGKLSRHKKIKSVRINTMDYNKNKNTTTIKNSKENYDFKSPDQNAKMNEND